MTAGETRRVRDVSLGRDVRLMDFVNLYGCSIGDETLVGPFVEIQEGARVGSRCKVESHTFICAGTVIEDEVFIGHHVTFTNDRYPAATGEDGTPKGADDWTMEPAVVERRASVGSGAVILPGVRVGRGAMVGAGAVVTRDVPPQAVVAGNPARELPPKDGDGRVPLFDPRAEYAEIRSDVDAAIGQVIRSGRFVGGPEVAAFEEEFGRVVGDRPVASVGSGTEALRLSLSAVGVGPGDEVILPANTFTATAMAVQSLEAVPVLSDVDPDIYVMTPEIVEPLFTDRTRAIVPVHLYGHPAPMPGICALAREHGVAVVEDAAQAHGALIEGRPAGAWGVAAAFSFYPSKNLGAYGDGGAVAGDPEVVERVRLLRDLGRDSRGAHVVEGTNSRLDAVQAAVLRAKLSHLDRWIARRRWLADRYGDLLSTLPVTSPAEAAWASHAYHLYVVRLSGRDGVRRALGEAGIEAGVHYPVPIHLQPAHAGRVRVPAGAPVAERLAGEILSLPLYPQLTAVQQERVVAALRRALAAAA